MLSLWTSLQHVGLTSSRCACVQFPVEKADLAPAASIKAAAKIAAANMMTFYSGNLPGNIPGELPGPYYWWEAGAMFGQLIHYWNLTGDATYNDIVSQALQFQIGADDDYMPANQTADLVRRRMIS